MWTLKLRGNIRAVLSSAVNPDWERTAVLQGARCLIMRTFVPCVPYPVRNARKVIQVTLHAPLDLTVRCKEGLYDPAAEHDACGVGMVATMNRRPERRVIDKAIEVLRNLDHRGAVGAEENTGDGAGILMGMPDAFMRAVVDAPLPEPGHYAAGIAFLDRDTAACGRQQQAIAAIVREEGLEPLAWRTVPTDPNGLGLQALASMPAFVTLVVASPDGSLGGLDLERKAFRIRKRVEHEVGVYFASLSGRTITYKGMLTTMQLTGFFPDLNDERMAARVAIVHSRFSTNTFPSWPLAQPFRLLAHNGEINTIQGNRNWLQAREGRLSSELLGEFEPLLPIATPGYSDSGTFDECLELLHLAGRSLPHAILMMLPPAWENDDTLDPDVRAFYEYNNTLIEPWDGPAHIIFTDGTQVGALLDRNGFRPGRWQLDDTGLVVLASEAGVLPDVPTEHVSAKGRLEPGRMFLVDTAEGRIVPDDEIKHALAAQHPYRQWVEGNSVHMNELPAREHVNHSYESVLRRQRAFGYTEEDIKLILNPMADTGKEPLGSMGNDTPMAVLSDRSRMLFDYFTQKFAQVTNPPLDWERERIVTCLESAIGPEPNLLEDTELHAKKILIPLPVINSEEMAQLKRLDRAAILDGYYRPFVVKGLYQVAGGGPALESRLDEIFADIDRAIADGANFIVLSDRGSDHTWAPIPSLLLTSAVQHHLLRRHTRTQVSLAVEAGDVREIHHVALLIAYGAACVNPYLAFETVEDQSRRGYLTVDAATAVTNVTHALSIGVLKIMSKMGVSTIMSYRGAQLFEAVGLNKTVIDRYFTGTTSQVGGIGLDEIAEEVARRHRVAYPNQWTVTAHDELPTGGDYKWRRTGENHLNDPEAIFLLQQSTQRGDYGMFKRYSAHINSTSHRLMTLRGLMRFKPTRQPIPIDEVEPASEIVKRFSTGAMSYGSISQEAHETLAIAMNMIGARSNSGEGGESDDRINDPLRVSRIKQIASARFGVTSDYLVHATDLQIKLAQGAKPGEGGHLPGAKVPPWIAKVRHSTPGVELISPPPHHDIYSIEDLKQLINDAKMANPKARIHVKLVSEFGVGTIAAGVAKCHADVVLISGYDGGTGAAPRSSIQNAGLPWELGLAETHQTLIQNGLRGKVLLETDGKLLTGRDVAVAAMLGAEEFGFATAPLVAMGCVMMRVCNLDTCPMGIATQNPELRKRFAGKPEYIMNFMRFVAQELREYMARLGVRTVDELVGRADLLKAREDLPPRVKTMDFSPILDTAFAADRDDVRYDHKKWYDFHLEKTVDQTVLLKKFQPALKSASHKTVQLHVSSTDRTVGTMFGSEITRRYGNTLPEDTFVVECTGGGGQSFGAFIPKGLTLRLEGDSNDYFGKGLSGGKLILFPPKGAAFRADENVIVGNVALYGATSGKAFIAGVAGERFCVRNSGAWAVVEGVGDHGCEYMTGGRVAVLGETGKNFAAGMSGGVAYVYDPRNDLYLRTNKSLVSLEQLNNKYDVQELKSMIEEHVAATGSEKGREILENFADYVPHFKKVMPHDYQKMLSMISKMEEKGYTVEQAQIEAFYAMKGVH